jgi:hypothetical protein
MLSPPHHDILTNKNVQILHFINPVINTMYHFTRCVNDGIRKVHTDQDATDMKCLKQILF